MSGSLFYQSATIPAFSIVVNCEFFFFIFFICMTLEANRIMFQGLTHSNIILPHRFLSPPGSPCYCKVPVQESLVWDLFEQQIQNHLVIHDASIFFDVGNKFTISVIVIHLVFNTIEWRGQKHVVTVYILANIWNTAFWHILGYHHLNVVEYCCLLSYHLDLPP